jgi:NAD(P)H-hydrate epimerase
VNVKVIYVTPAKNEDSARYMESYTEAGGVLIKYSDDPDGVADVITSATLVVDALHGIAFAGELKGEELILVELANSSTGFIVAVDIPTGVCADGQVSSNCVLADMTVTFTAHKAATVSNPALEYCGEVVVADIGIPEDIIRSIRPAGCIIDEGILEYLPVRPTNSSKGNYGTLLALVGSPNMPGAAYLASLGALRSGLGLLKLTADSETLAILKNRLAEPVFVPFSKDIANDYKYSALLVGCGIGRNYDGTMKQIRTVRQGKLRGGTRLWNW